MIDYFSFPAILAYICVIGLVVIVIVAGFIPDVWDILFFWIPRKEQSNQIENIKQEIEEISKYKQSIYSDGGVLAPAVIISARRVISWGGGYRRGHPFHLVDFEVEVKPETGVSFKAKFRNEIHREGYVILGDEVTSEQGRNIWVTYDPKDLSRAYLDHFDEDHESVMKEREVDIRRAAFNKLTEGNEDLKKIGEQAEAIITQVDDLNLPYPLKGSRAIHIYFNVTPKTGFIFQAEGDFLIGDSLITKYSVGRKVFVRFDPHYPQKAVLDSERNKTLK